MKNTERYIDFTRVNNCINGNPRYVCHFLAFKPYQKLNEPYKSFSYDEALIKGRKLGGRKFHNKQYGGGIVFSSYNLRNLSDSILLLTGDAVKYWRDPKEYESKNGNTKNGEITHALFLIPSNTGRVIAPQALSPFMSA